MKDEIFDWHGNSTKTFTFKSLIMHGFILALELRKPNYSLCLNLIKLLIGT